MANPEKSPDTILNIRIFHFMLLAIIFTSFMAFSNGTLSVKNNACDKKQIGNCVGSISCIDQKICQEYNCKKCYKMANRKFGNRVTMEFECLDFYHCEETLSLGSIFIFHIIMVIVLMGSLALTFEIDTSGKDKVDDRNNKNKVDDRDNKNKVENKVDNDGVDDWSD